MSQRPSFRDIAPPIDVDDGALTKLADQMGVPTLVKAPVKPPVNDQQTHEDAPKPEASPSPTRKDKDSQALKKMAFASIPRRKTSEKLTMELPGYLIDDLKQEAVNRRTTARHLVMLALQSVGFHVDPADLVPYAPRRKPGKK